MQRKRNPGSRRNYRKNFQYDKPLARGDERRVAMNDARGDYNSKRLLRELGMDVDARRLRVVPVGQCILFGGHRGCGKSTELRAIAAELAGPERFLVSRSTRCRRSTSTT